jgi:hypothetical protein
VGHPATSLPTLRKERGRVGHPRLSVRRENTRSLDFARDDRIMVRHQDRLNAALGEDSARLRDIVRSGDDGLRHWDRNVATRSREVESDDIGDQDVDVAGGVFAFFLLISAGVNGLRGFGLDAETALPVVEDEVVAVCCRPRAWRVSGPGFRLCAGRRLWPVLRHAWCWDGRRAQWWVAEPQRPVKTAIEWGRQSVRSHSPENRRRVVHPREERAFGGWGGALR